MLMLLPINLLLKKICFRSLLKICTLPPSNPVSVQALKYYRKPAKTHCTNIQTLLTMFGVDPTSLEMVPAVTNSLAYELPLEIDIADSKEEAIEQEAKDEAGTRIFLDGSC
jgi:hypothetical protein